MSTNVLNTLLELLHTAILRSFEDHVLKEMSSSIRFERLVSTPSIDPYSEGGGLEREIGFCGHSEAVREDGDLRQGRR